MCLHYGCVGAVGHVRARGLSGTSSHVGLLGVSLHMSVVSTTACLEHYG